MAVEAAGPGTAGSGRRQVESYFTGAAQQRRAVSDPPDDLITCCGPQRLGVAW